MCALCLGRHTPGRVVGRALIRGYQLTLSPIVGRSCRYLPTCSAYAEEAVAHFGLWPGAWMALARLLRCHPWGGSGYDPVPEALPLRYSAATPWRAGRWRSRPVG